jgi:hypothetical protein
VTDEFIRSTYKVGHAGVQAEPSAVVVSCVGPKYCTREGWLKVDGGMAGGEGSSVGM